MDQEYASKSQIENQTYPYLTITGIVQLRIKALEVFSENWKWV